MDGVQVLLIDWTSILNTFIGSIPLIIVAVTGLVKVMQVEKNTNSMREQLVASTKAEALTTGRAEGKSWERGRVAAKAEAHDAGVAEERARLRNQEDTDEQ